MIPAAPLIALLLSLHTCAREPQTPARAERVTMIAESIAEVSDTPDDAAGLAAIAVNESSLCEDVHAGKRKGGPGEGLWQIEPGSRRERPFSGLDAASTRHAASEALWLWRHTRGCRSLAARFGAYAGLGCRAWPGARARVGIYGFVTMRLSRGHTHTQTGRNSPRTPLRPHDTSTPASALAHSPRRPPRLARFV